MKKCTFVVDKVASLGFVVSSKGVHVDESKIEAIKTWPQPTNLQQVRSFLGLAGFYRCFVKDFSTIDAPLHALSKKNAPFVWGSLQSTAFDELKSLLTHAPFLLCPILTKLLRFIVMQVVPELAEFLKKCTFVVDKVASLGFVVSSKGVHVDESKIEAIKTWPQPTNLQQVRSFLGLAGFYRCFVKDFSTIDAPLHALSKKNAPFVWGSLQSTAFDELKSLLTHAPFLLCPILTKLLRFIVMQVVPELAEF